MVSVNLLQITMKAGLEQGKIVCVGSGGIGYLCVYVCVVCLHAYTHASWRDRHIGIKAYINISLKYTFLFIIQYFRMKVLYVHGLFCPPF